MANPIIGGRLSEETRQRSKAAERSPHYLSNAVVGRDFDIEKARQAERQLIKSRWERYELAGETIDHDEVKGWAAGLIADFRRGP